MEPCILESRPGWCSWDWEAGIGSPGRLLQQCAAHAFRCLAGLLFFLSRIVRKPQIQWCTRMPVLAKSPRMSHRQRCLFPVSLLCKRPCLVDAAWRWEELCRLLSFLSRALVLDWIDNCFSGWCRWDGVRGGGRSGGKGGVVKRLGKHGACTNVAVYLSARL